MKYLAAVVLTITLCLCGCTKAENRPEERVELYLRQILPDQKPVNYLEVDKDIASAFLFHIAVYHGQVHGHRSVMTTDEIERNINACSTVGAMIVDLEYTPAEYDEISGNWYPHPHEPEYNLYYVVHNIEVDGDYLNAYVSCIGFSEENGLYTFSPDGQIQYEEDLRYITFEDMDSLKKKILSEPENYEIISIGLRENQGELSLSGS
ncbi:MAG: hypothetical protein E7658_09265 [Ruminococcaceae bacterium]|nr:hypothetical protein [Oscillospiraceae bacterium]